MCSSRPTIPSSDTDFGADRVTARAVVDLAVLAQLAELRPARSLAFEHGLEGGGLDRTR